MAFQALPGFRDFYPADFAAREHLFNAWRSAALRFGFVPYDGPPLEPLDLYTTKSGQEIVHQLYNFKDKGNREVALRPEMTPTLARMAGLKHREYKKPMKWFAIPQLFRYERQQRGRLREHFQWNCDIIGEPGLGAEAELLAVLASALQNLGLKSSDFVIRLSDRQFWVDFLNEHQVPAEKHYDFFQALDKMERAEESETRAKLGPLADKVYAIFANGGTSPRLDALAAKLQALGLGDFFQIDLKIIRGLAYYTGIVFEVHDRAGVFRAIAGGGRYDNLLKQLSGTDLPAIGFGMGDVVLLELLKDKGLLPPLKPSIDFFIVLGDESRRLDALALAGSLRQAGFSVDYALSELKFPKQLDLATDRGARYGLVVDAAFDSGRIGLRDLATRAQVEIGFTRQDGTFSFDPPLPRPGI